MWGAPPESPPTVSQFDIIWGPIHLRPVYQIPIHMQSESDRWKPIIEKEQEVNWGRDGF